MKKTITIISDNETGQCAIQMPCNFNLYPVAPTEMISNSFKISLNEASEKTHIDVRCGALNIVETQ